MFHPIPDAVLGRMRYLKEADSRDRQDGTPRLKRLRQIPEETGRFLAVLAASAPKGRFIEIGASAGYSALWLALACREVGARLTTFEVLPEKVRLARETFQAAGVEDVVELVEGDAGLFLPDCREIAFCFLDAEKDLYAGFYERVVPNLVSGGILVADNVLSHADELRPVVERALSDARVDALVVPIGKGELLCRKR